MIQHKHSRNRLSVFSYSILIRPLKISNNIILLESRCDYQSIHGHLEHDLSLEPQHILYHERNNPFKLTICI